MSCVRCRVEGRVQGVAYRAATRARARALGVTGWVRNLADGSVEVLACGEGEALAALRDWLREGPDYAVVWRVECDPAPAQAFAEFTIR